MTKKGPLGKAEKYYVQGHYKTLEAKQIAKELDRPISAVKKHIELVKKEEPKDVINAGTSMARQEGVVTMTETASELAETSKTRTNNYSRRSNCVTGTKNS